MALVEGTDLPHSNARRGPRLPARKAPQVRLRRGRWSGVDLATAINQLLRRKWWVALVLAVAVFGAVITAYDMKGFPPKFEKRSLEFGSAGAQILVDSPGTALADLRREFTPLAERAQVYSQFMASPAVKDSIAKAAGIPPSVLVAEASLGTENLPRTAVEPGEGERANELLAEGVGYRLSFEAQEDLPIVAIRSQAPTAAEAIKLADSAVTGLRNYLRTAEAKQEEIPDKRRVQVVRLGQAKGGMVNDGVNHIVAAMVFLAVLGLGCGLILVAVNVAAGMREGRPSSAPEALPTLDLGGWPSETGNGNGHGNVSSLDQPRRGAARGARQRSAKRGGE